MEMACSSLSRRRRKTGQLGLMKERKSGKQSPRSGGLVTHHRLHLFQAANNCQVPSTPSSWECFLFLFLPIKFDSFKKIMIREMKWPTPIKRTKPLLNPKNRAITCQKAAVFVENCRLRTVGCDILAINLSESYDRRRDAKRRPVAQR